MCWSEHIFVIISFAWLCLTSKVVHTNKFKSRSIKSVTVILLLLPMQLQQKLRPSIYVSPRSSRQKYVTLFTKEILNRKPHFLCKMNFIQHLSFYWKFLLKKMYLLSWSAKLHSIYQPIFEQLTKKKQFTTQKTRFSIKDVFSKCDQIRSFLQIWSHLLKKFLTENFNVVVKCSNIKLYVKRTKSLWIFYFEKDSKGPFNGCTHQWFINLYINLLSRGS